MIGNQTRILALLCTTVVGCATLRVAPDLPARHTTTLGPFTVVSEKPLTVRPELLLELERLQNDVETTLPLVGRSDHGALQTVASAGSPLPPETEIRIYLFDEPKSYRTYMSSHYPTLPQRRAYFIRNGDAIAVYACFSDRLVEDLRHELTHALLNARVGVVPLWLDEGLAEYFEAPGGFNAPHAAALADELDRGWQPDLERLEKLDDVSDMQQQDYREAWAWVHLLLTRGGAPRQALLDYLESLESGGEPEPFAPRLATALPQRRRELVKHLQQTRTAAKATADAS
jgi:hypothetical protein